MEAELKAPEDSHKSTQPISKAEFLKEIEPFRHLPDFMKLPLPSFVFQELPEFRGTPQERIEENIQYLEKQEKAETEEQKLENARERLRKKLEKKKQLK